MVTKQLVFLLALATAPAVLRAAPFRGFFPATSTDGKEYYVYGEGDEFDAVFETTDGWTVMRKDGQPGYWYAVEAGGRLIASDVEVGFETTVIPSRLPKHLRDGSPEHEAEIEARVAEDEALCGTRAAWDLRMGNCIEPAESQGVFSKFFSWIAGLFGDDVEQERAPFAAPPKQATVGDVVGFTILVDFPRKGSDKTEAQAVHPNVDFAYIDRMLNSTAPVKSYADYSVNQYYRDISRGRLNFTNLIADYVLMDKPRSYYDDSSKKCGECATKLMRDVVAKLKSTGRWDSEIVPMVQRLSYDKKTKRFLALSVMFAGNDAETWSYGLWAHKSTTSVWPTVTMPDGKTKVRFSTYQISPITSWPCISTFCHECGHMVCGFPDLYDYTRKTHGAGMFSLMALNSFGPIDPYLAEAAGWVDTRPLPEQGWVTLPCGRDVVYKYQHPTDAKQYFLIENRQKEGLDAEMPGKGVLIWRCNRGGNNTNGGGSNIGKGGNKYRKNFELSVVQADGLYDIERRANSGRDDDYWKDGNTAAGYENEASDKTVPDLTWKNNAASGLRLSRFSKSGSEMKVWVGDDKIKEPVQVETAGFDGKYDRKAHKIDVQVLSPDKGVTVTYCKTRDGKYSKSNPSYRAVGEHTTWFKCVADGYLTTNGCERIVIRK